MLRPAAVILLQENLGCAFESPAWGCHLTLILATLITIYRREADRRRVPRKASLVVIGVLALVQRSGPPSEERVQRKVHTRETLMLTCHCLVSRGGSGQV